MNRSEAETAVRSSARFTCRGPFLLPEEGRILFADKWRGLVAAGDLAAAIALKEVIEASINLPPVPCTDWDSTYRRIAGLAYAHTETCGYDFMNTICGGPFDGLEHDYICPKCGVTGTYRAPFFTLED